MFTQNNKAKRKVGIIDVGGGLRGVYAAEVLDYCLDNNIQFDVGIGVSAGSANLASYTANQPRRNHTFYTEYALRKQYMGIGNFIRKKSFIDLDYVYGTLSNSDGESPLDYNALAHNHMEFIVVATEAETGQVKYFNKNNISPDNYDIFKASSAIPYVCQPYIIDNVPYYDGALADTIPIEKAFQLSCDKIILLLTLPKDTIRTPDKDIMLAKRIQKKYPLAAEKLRNRAEQYNNGVALAKKYEEQGKLLIVAPDDTCGVSTLSRDAQALCNLYEKGYKDSAKIGKFLYADIPSGNVVKQS